MRYSRMSSLMIKFSLESSGLFDVVPLRVPNISERICALICERTPLSSKVYLSTSLSSLIDAIIQICAIMQQLFIELQLVMQYKQIKATSNNFSVLKIIIQYLSEGSTGKKNLFIIHYKLIKMKKQVPQFVEIPDEIPYRKITAFNIKQVKYNNGAFDIKLDRKCENLPEEKQYRITRKTADFHWLVDQLTKESPWAIVLPTVAEPSWSLMEVISTDQFKTKLRKWSNESLQCRTVERFFKIMGQITIKSIYKQHGFTHSSLYTFLDKSYELYKSEKYQQTGVKEVTASSSSTLTSLAQSIGKGSMKLLGMLNVLKQEQPSRYLQTQLSQCQVLKGELEEFNNELVNLQTSLEVLEINFLNQQKNLKSKEQRLYQIYIKSSQILRLLTEIMGEVGEVSKRCEILQGRSEDKASAKQQIEAYDKYIANEIADLQSEFTSTVQEFYEKCFEEHVNIKIINLYPTKL